MVEQVLQEQMQIQMEVMQQVVLGLIMIFKQGMIKSILVAVV